MNDTEVYKILEQLRRELMDAALPHIEKHDLRVISSKVEVDARRGAQMMIIIQPREKR